MDQRKKKKRMRRWSNHNESFPIGSSPSNGSVIRQHGEENIRQVDVTSSSVEKVVIANFVDGVSSCQEHLNDLHSEHYFAAKKKGKVILKEVTVENAVHSVSGTCYNREAPMWDAVDVEKKPLQYVSPTNSYIHKEEHSSRCLPEWRNESDMVDKDLDSVICKSFPIPANHHRSSTFVGAFPHPSVVSQRDDNLRKFVNGKRKSSSSVSKSGETSYSILSQQPSDPKPQTLNSKHDISYRDGCDCTPMDIDEQYPEVSWSTQRQSTEHWYNSYVNASQIESDERLAHEIQEQFDREIAEFSDIEGMESSAAQLYSCSEQSSFYENDFSPSTENAAMRFRNLVHDEMCPEMAIFVEVRNFGHELDLETRLGFLEDMEDFDEDDMFEYGDISFHHSSHEFEYEIIIDYEESSLQHTGSSESRINSLPLSVVQTTVGREACSVCLEIPSVGETIRHLPCLHKFHKECIDPWLKRRALCPVCKYSVT